MVGQGDVEVTTGTTVHPEWVGPDSGLMFSQNINMRPDVDHRCETA